jgi:hypothetical protein
VRIRAFQTLDCANKVRVHYRFEGALSKALFACFSDAAISVNEFSRFVASARDHFTITREGRFHAGGILGDNLMVVTYGKIASAWPGEEIAEFEARLREAGYGRVEYGRGGDGA